jgi:DNA-binding CsgD family transcriptional regulator
VPCHLKNMAPRITDRELQVMKLAAMGMLDKEIAKDLDLTLATVRTYWDRAKRKMTAVNKTHAVCLAIGRGLICPPCPAMTGQTAASIFPSSSDVAV